MLVSLRGQRVKDDVFETLKLALSDFNDASPDYTVTRLKLSYLSYEIQQDSFCGRGCGKFG